MMQPRFERRQGASVATLVEQPRFRAGFDFLRLRGDAGEVDAELANWWEDYSLADEAGRRALLDAVRPSGGARRARASKPRTAAPGEPGERAAPGEPADQEAPADPPGLEGDAPRKRRRRRRKPAGAVPADRDASGDDPVSNPSRDV